MTGRPAESNQSIVLQELHDRLAAAVDQLGSGEQWQAWLAFARGFHRYSFNNLLLIWSQRPDATAVASYRTWQAKGRQVRRGELGLRILAPILRRVPVLDDQDRPVRDNNGSPQHRQKVTGYRPVPVFDVAQTDGPPIPESVAPVLLAGAAPNGLWAALGAEVSDRGYRLLRGSLTDLNGAIGLTDLRRREVWVRADVNPAQAAKTLAHELGHILLHAEPHAGEQDGRIDCVGVREVEAESVAYLVCAAHGLVSDGYTFPYVASWASGLARAEGVPMSDIVARTGTRVMRAAGQLIDATTADQVTDPAGQALAAVIADGVDWAQTLREQSSRVTAIAVTNVEPQVLLGVVADSQEFFQARIRQSWVPGYLDRRNLGLALARHGLGHAPEGWTNLVEFLSKLGYSDDHIEAAGMATRSRSGHLVDRFRDRLTIPVLDQAGDLVAFIGRLAPGRDEDRYSPRYLNSPATPLYTKGDVLSGLGMHRARITSGYLPVLCEGPLDAIAIDLAAQEAGARMVGIAVSGTALTDRHVAQLTALVGDRPVCLAFDGDSAGRAATKAAWRRLTDPGPRPITAAVVPEGTDPAQLLTAGNAGALVATVTEARTAAEVVVDHTLAGVDLFGNSARELAAFRELLPYADRIPNDERVAFVVALAGRLHIDIDIAAAEVANRDPAMLADRIVDHCKEVEARFESTSPAAGLHPDAIHAPDAPHRRLT